MTVCMPLPTITLLPSSHGSRCLWLTTKHPNCGTRPVPTKLPKLHLNNSSCYVGPLTNLPRQKLCPDRPLGALPSLTYHFDSPLWTGYGMEMRWREWIYRSPSISLTDRCSFFVWPWGMRRLNLFSLSWFSTPSINIHSIMVLFS